MGSQQTDCPYRCGLRPPQPDHPGRYRAQPGQTGPAGTAGRRPGVTGAHPLACRYKTIPTPTHRRQMGDSCITRGGMVSSSLPHHTHTFAVDPHLRPKLPRRRPRSASTLCHASPHSLRSLSALITRITDYLPAAGIPADSVSVGIYANLYEHVGLQGDMADAGKMGGSTPLGSRIVGLQKHRKKAPVASPEAAGRAIGRCGWALCLLMGSRLWRGSAAVWCGRCDRSSSWRRCQP